MKLKIGQGKDTKKEVVGMERKTEQGKNTKLLVMAIAVGLLVLVSAVQAIELSNLRGTIDTELASLKAATPSTTAGSSSGGTLQQNVSNLPSMVGGC